MDDQMHLIDDFFLGKLSEEESRAFEERITKDPAFAADVAFYLSAKRSALEMANEEKKKRYKEIYSATNGHQKKEPGKVVRMKYVMRVALAAAVITAIFVTINPFSNPSPSDLANKYINENPISLTMGIESEMQSASKLYDEKKYNEALLAFEEIIRKDSSSAKAYEYAGLSALRQSNYDKALQHFKLLEKYPGLHSNKGVFLQALTLMKRSQKGDKAHAKLLLERVVKENLEEKATARQWLEDF